MTTERPLHPRAPRGGTAALLLLGALSAGCATQESRRGETVDVSKYPPEIREAYEVFAVRCSRCHTLARPLDARINDPQHWIRYVHRMRLQPGSGIDAQNAEIILRFLLYYHGHTRPQAAELLGVAERTVYRRWASACARLSDALGGHLPQG